MMPALMPARRRGFRGGSDGRSKKRRLKRDFDVRCVVTSLELNARDRSKYGRNK